MQMDSLGAMEGVATYSTQTLISGPALSQQSSSSCFWYSDGLQPVKDLLLSTERGLKMSLKFLQGKLMLWNRLLLHGEILLPWTHGYSEVSNGRFLCILTSILICRDGFTLIVFPSERYTYSS